MSIAPSTHRTYNTYIKKLYNFCLENDYYFPPVRSDVLADFFISVADLSNKPGGTLKVCFFALKKFYTIIGLPSVMSSELSDLIKGLTITGTTEPMKRSKQMPVANFVDLFVR